MRTLTLAAVLCVVAHAADNAAIAPQEATGNRHLATSLGAEAIMIPRMLSYQGKLTDSLGVPVADTTYSVGFRLYTVPSGGSPFWSETQTVRTRSGLFAVLLGAVTSIDSVPDAGVVYLGIAVSGGAELAQRLRIASAAYAYLSTRAANADLLQGKDTAGLDARYVNAGQANSVTSAMIANGTIAAVDLGQMGASSGQVMKWTGSAWAPRNDSVGGGGGGGTVTSVSQGTGVTCTPNPITTTGTVSLNRTYTDNRYVNVTGDSMSGMLSIGDQLKVHDKAALGYSCYNNGSAAFCAGYGNSAGGDRASITGGEDNSASGKYSHVGGGSENVTSGLWTTVGGGNVNEVTDSAGTIAGGRENWATASYATVGGGQNNTASVRYATVAGGYLNSAESTHATVAGGSGNTASGMKSFVGGGSNNVASGYGSAVAGGLSCNAAGQGSFVGGGIGHDVLGTYATIAGGDNNDADSSYAFVGGGRYNRAGERYATVTGGYDNIADSVYATVGGGIWNRAENRGATASGGRYSVAGGQYSTVAGGNANYAPGENASIGGGYANRAIGECATVPGGYLDSAAADYSFATNQRSKVPSGYDNSAAFNGQTATASNQTRVGTLSKAGGSFTIDHPLDPYGKILNHYFIEGPEMRNIYDGEAVLDASGRAVVEMPDYFDALNRSPRVQLTGVGTQEVVYVVEDVSGNRFTIGGPAGVKVYWQVTGERKDVSAEATRRMMPVEQLKSGPLAGRMLDDDFLVGCMDQLVREGRAQGIDFRTAAGRARYEKVKQHMREAE